MVELLYALILLPITGWVIAFGYETWLALGRSEGGDYSVGTAYMHASWEITHTLLVYGFTVFVVSHADSLDILDRTLFIPVCVFMMSLLVRGCLYLYLFYGPQTIKHPELYHSVLAASYVVSMVSVLCGFILTIINIQLYSLTPSTENMPIIGFGFVLTSVLCFLPIRAAYTYKSD